MGKIKSTFNFDERATEKLKEIASRAGVSRSEILRRAIALYGFIEENSVDGRSYIIKSDGTKVELFLF